MNEYLDEYYLKIYDECLNGTYQNEKLKPVIPIICETVKRYDGELVCSNGLNPEELLYLKQKNMRAFIVDLLYISYHVVQTNNDKDYSMVLNYLYKTHTEWRMLEPSINAIYFPNEYYENKQFEYMMVFRFFAHNSMYLNLINKEYSFRLVDFVRVYREYWNTFPQNVKFFRKHIFFEKYGMIIMALFYKDNIPIENLRKAFDFIIDNYSLLDDFLRNNDDGKHKKELEDYLIDRIIHNYMNGESKMIIS